MSKIVDSTLYDGHSLFSTNDLTFEEFHSMASIKDSKERNKLVRSKLRKDYDKNRIHEIAPMSFFEEFSSFLVFAFGIPGNIYFKY